MKFRSVPAITTRYWAAISLTSMFGANLGDFVARYLHMGHVRGLPYIGAAFVLIALGGVLSRVDWEGWYWLGIVALRTAATNLADLATHDGALGTIPVCAILAFLLVAVLLVRRALVPEAATTDTPRADLGFWTAMLIAGTLGTALGDGIADASGLALATVLTAIAVIAALSLRTRAPIGLLAGYWIAIVCIRTFGTNAGDLIAHTIGLRASTPLTGAALVILLVLWRDRPVALIGGRALES